MENSFLTIEDCFAGLTISTSNNLHLILKRFSNEVDTVIRLSLIGGRAARYTP